MTKEKILVFNNLSVEVYGDWVTCPHCDNLGKANSMLVPSGMERCPLCGEETMWANKDNGEYELSVEEVEKRFDIVKIDAKYEEYYDYMSGEPVLISLENEKEGNSD